MGKKVFLYALLLLGFSTKQAFGQTEHINVYLEYFRVSQTSLCDFFLDGQSDFGVSVRVLDDFNTPNINENSNLLSFPRGGCWVKAEDNGPYQYNLPAKQQLIFSGDYCNFNNINFRLEWIGFESDGGLYPSANKIAGRTAIQTEILNVSPNSDRIYIFSASGSSSGCSQDYTIRIKVTRSGSPLFLEASASKTQVCYGEPVTLTALGNAPNIVWSNGVTDGVPFVPPATNTYYKVTGSANGLDVPNCTVTDNIVIYVNELFVTANASATEICAGEQVTLTGSGADSFTWDNGVTDGVPFSPSQTTTYTVTGSDPMGCQAQDQVTIIVNPLPTVTANASATEICAGEQITLTGSGASSYTWDNGVSDGVAFTPTQTTTYTVTGTDANGCQAQDQVTVIVNPLPTVTANASATEICAGEQVTLTGSGASTYTWDNGVSDGVAFTPAQTTTYTVTGTDANGCQAQDQVTVTVKPLPSVSVSASATEICAGEQVILLATGADVMTWDNNVENGVAFTPTQTNTYTLTATDNNGCQIQEQVTVTVNPLPDIAIDASATQLCAGEQVTLTASGANTLVWDNGVSNGVAFTPTQTATYTVTGTNANGCQAQDQITITVNPLPVVTAIASATEICAGEQITLTGTGASSYTWDNGVSDGVAFTPAQTTTYTVTGTDANGCQAQDQVTVTVKPLPSVSVTASATEICAGEQVILLATGADVMTWDNNVENGVAFTPTQTNTYTLTATDNNGCQIQEQVTVTVNPLPDITIDASTTQICAGESVTLTASGTDTFVWSDNIANGEPFTPTQTATYTVTGTDANGCQAQDQITITVNPLPVVTATASTTEICAGEKVTLTATGAVTYDWDNGVTNGVAFAPTQTTTYTVTGTDANGCQAQDQITVTVNEVSADIQITGNTVTAIETDATYEWFKCGGMLVASGNQTQSFAETGAYYLKVTKNGCSVESACFDITVTGLQEATFNNLPVSIYPNPTSGRLTVEFSGQAHSFIIEIKDAKGKKVFRQTYEASQTTLLLDLVNYKAGTYYIQIFNKHDQVSLPVIVAKH